MKYKVGNNREKKKEEGKIIRDNED